MSEPKDCKRILVYKRTHEGDPDQRIGRFGIYDCMVGIRDRVFDAVIGVGGIGARAQSNGISGLVNWVGVGPTKSRERCRFGYNVTMVRFERFRYLVADGIDLHKAAPKLAELIYSGKIRHMIVDVRFPDEFREARKLLQKYAAKSEKVQKPASHATRQDRCARSKECS
jgi:hypothetical protein